MAFFVEPSGESNDDDNVPDRLDLELIALGKRVNLSFAEMNELRLSDLFCYGRLYSGREDDKPKQATQADINRFYG